MPGSPARPVTVNQAVAWNMARWRRAAEMTQDQLGARLGWTGAAVSDAERSWSGQRTRQFDADLIAGLATALGIPVVALLLPPPGCTFRIPGGHLGGTELTRVLIPDNDEDTPVMGEYRDAWNSAVLALARDDPGQERLVARWTGDTAGRRAEVAAVMRAEREELLKAAGKSAARLGRIADAIERQEGSGQ